MASASDLLRIENLDVSFSVFGDKLRVVKNAELRVLPGKVTALVGESGSGKSVISQSIMGILPNAAQATGSILFTDPLNGETTDILQFGRDSEEMRDSARQAHGDDLPGADDLALAAAHRRQPDQRSPADPYRSR